MRAPSWLAQPKHVAHEGDRAHGADVALGAPGCTPQPRTSSAIAALDQTSTSLEQRARTHAGSASGRSPRAAPVPRTPGALGVDGLQGHRIDAVTRSRSPSRSVIRHGPNSRTGSSVERRHSHPWLDPPMSIPAALGNTISSSCVRIAIVCSKIDNERPRHGRRRIRLDLVNGMCMAAAHQCHRRIPDHANRRARANSHQCWFGHVGDAVRLLAQTVARRQARQRTESAPHQCLSPYTVPAAAGLKC